MFSQDLQERPMNQPTVNSLKPTETLTLIVYILQALTFPTGGLTALIAVIINYVKLEDVAGTWLASHFRWQIRTFWFGLLWGVIGGATFLIVVGWFILVANAVWIIYRIVKGILRLLENKAMYTTPLV
jgi:uncharacterized membrane protein